MVSDVPQRAVRWADHLLAAFVRVAGWAALAALLAFPAIKRRPEGFVPLAVAAPLAVMLWRRRGALANALLKFRQWWVVVVFALIAQALLVLWLQPHPLFDAHFVIEEARALAREGKFSPLTYYAPGQTVYYAALFKLFGDDPLVAQLGQIPLFALLLLGCAALAREALPSAARPFSVAAIAAYPSLILYALVTPYYFYLYTACFVLMAACWRKAERDMRWAAIGGLIGAIGALTKAVLLIAPAQFLAYITLSLGLRRRAAVAWLVFTLALCAGIAPWVWRNYKVFGRPVLIATSGPLVFYSANNPESDGLYSPLPDAVRVETPEQMLAHMEWCRRQALTFIRERPIHFARLVLRKWLMTWGTETTYVELINRRGASISWLDPALRFVAQVGWAVCVMLWAYAGARRLWLRAEPSSVERIAGLVVLGKLIVYGLYEGGARHHLPAVPFLILYVVASGFDVSPRESSHSSRSA